MITLELPPDVEQKLRAKAAAEGVAVEELLRRLAEREVDPPPHPLYGCLAHLGVSISEEDIREMRREAWANFPRDIPDSGNP